MLQEIVKQFRATNPLDGMAKAELVKQFCLEARNTLVRGAAFTKPELMGSEDFQRILDLLDPQSPDYGIGTEMDRAVRLFNKGMVSLNS